MAYKSWQGSKPYRPRSGDTLAAIAERETAAGNAISAEDIARFNWGTDDPEEIQTLMRDELGARARDGDKGYLISADDEARTALRIPESFEQRGFSLERTHQIRVNRKECPPQFLDCCSLPAVTFDFGSSFVKPAVVDHLGAVETLIQTYPDAQLMVFGHTDAVGDELYNKKLSERRAWAVHAFILNDPEAWETLYNHPDEKWGLEVVQEILADLGHDPGTVDGDMGKATRGAMRQFLGLDEDAAVKNDAAFRKELFAAYMGGKHDIEISADRFLEPGFMGCGEFNLLEPTDKAEEKNRRVTFYAFNKDRLPNLPCAFADCGPCRNQMVSLENRHQEGFTCSFYDSWAKRCPCESELHSVSLLIRKYPVTSRTVSHLMDEYILRSTCGELGHARQAMSASTRDETYVELKWENVRADMVLTLVHKFGNEERVLLSEVPFSRLHIDGHVARNEVEDDPHTPPPEPHEFVDETDPDDWEDLDIEELKNSPWEDEYC